MPRLLLGAPGLLVFAGHWIDRGMGKWYRFSALAVALVPKDFLQIHVRLTNEQIEWLDKKSNEQAASRAQVIRNIILQEMAFEKKFQVERKDIYAATELGRSARLF